MSIDPSQLHLDTLAYAVGNGEEQFIALLTPEDRLAGFLRLSLPGEDSPPTHLVDLDGAAIVREVHVYGQSLEVGAEQRGAAQHVGLGTWLMEHAESVARDRSYRNLAVIAALGTRGYYRKLGYELGESYMIKRLRGEPS